jgi:uncharacterized protein YbbC (DUF1343 family)
MNALKLPGVLFRPIIFRPFYGRWKDSTLYGVQVHITNPATVDLLALQFHFLEVHHRLYPERNPFALASQPRLHSFDLAAGTDSIRKRLTEKMTYESIRAYLTKDIDSFRKVSQKYYLYH